ncbi:type IV toxin-antitoxin system AbiEi family antitoxin domain-containing protein [Jonesiaceae bacterium BS-20]|uniref:Type IV toxin-antitoxin system AbiEi family antitoxin domain-containing protein n=1 Tax=Jonesiaceae bacterium BS-20 TaxID=3120821 RepID=A0AAU7DXU0_9MICO
MRHDIPKVTSVQRPLIANSQAGAFTTAQAMASGATKRQVEYRLQKGTWVRVAGDGLRWSEDPVTPQMLAFCAHLTWSDAVVCGPNVIALMGMPLGELNDVHVITPHPRKPRLRLVPHEFKLRAEECVKWNGITVTNFHRSLMDTLVMLPPRAAQSLFVWVSSREKLSATDMESYLATARGRWGNRKLKRFLADSRAGIMSEAEARIHELLHRARVTGWEANVPVRDEYGIIGRADVLFLKQRVVIEVDGYTYHGPDRFQADRTRDNRLIAAGYRVLHFTWEDLTRRPHVVIDQIRILL